MGETTRRSLTKRFVESLKTTDPHGRKVYDLDAPGFFVSVYPTGRKTFGVRYPFRGSWRWRKLAPFGVLTVEEARREAVRILSRVALGGDPIAEEDRRDGLPTFAEWAMEYLGDARRRRKRPEIVEYHLKRARDEWGSRRLDDIRREDVALLFRSMRETPVNANRWLATVAACFNGAVRAGLIASNPAATVEKNRENPPRARVLSEEELARLWGAIELEDDPHVRGAFRLLLETGARLREGLHAKWEDFDLDGLLWRLPDPKAGRPQIVVLDGSTVEWLRVLPRVKDVDGKLSPYVFPGLDPAKPRFDLKKAWERIKARASLGDATIHDLRRTFGKLVARAAGIHMASALLRHSNVTITARVYAPLAEKERREAVTAVLPFIRRKAG